MRSVTCPFGHDRQLILQRLQASEEADDDFDPECLRGRYWEFIKADIRELIKG